MFHFLYSFEILIQGSKPQVIVMRYISVLIFLFFNIIMYPACKDKDSAGEAESQLIGEDYYSEITKHRNEMDNFFRSADSPLSDSLRKVFTGLKYYETDTNYRVSAQFEELKNGPVFTIQATGSIADTYKTMGILNFVLGGYKYSLEVYRNQSYKGKGQEVYFIPFYDLTNGKETYGGGRYLDIHTLATEYIILDFNNVYNPYCVYNHEYSCPVPPKQNSLKTEIRAGERL